MNRSSKYKSAESIWIFLGIIQCFVGVCDKLDFFCCNSFSQCSSFVMGTHTGLDSNQFY